MTGNVTCDVVEKQSAMLGYDDSHLACTLERRLFFPNLGVIASA
jgi:hypothetical protein